MPGVFPWGRPDFELEALRHVIAVRAALDALERQLVEGARRHGARWVEIAAILHMTPQGASKRHRGSQRGRRVDREPFVPTRKPR
jgi:hypothetical protein